MTGSDYFYLLCVASSTDYINSQIIDQFDYQSRPNAIDSCIQWISYKVVNVVQAVALNFPCNFQKVRTLVRCTYVFLGNGFQVQLIGSALVFSLQSQTVNDCEPRNVRGLSGVYGLFNHRASNKQHLSPGCGVFAITAPFTNALTYLLRGDRINVAHESNWVRDCSPSTSS